MPALSAAFVVPGELPGDTFGATILGHHFYIVIWDTMYNPLALSLKLKELFTDVFGGRVGRVTLENALWDGAASNRCQGDNRVAHTTSQPAVPVEYQPSKTARRH